MAIYTPVRPRWNPRGQVVNYVSRGRLCARGWPTEYRDANTEAQRRQRGKMSQVCDVLPYLKGLLAEGYSPVVKRNGRRVGAYHAAVSVALREWFDATPSGARLNPAKIRLTDGVRALPEGLDAVQADGKVRIAWQKTLRWRGANLLFAARLAEAREWVNATVALERGAMGVTLVLPTHWAKRSLEVWLAFVGNGGRCKTQTLHLTLAPVTLSPPPSPSGRGRRVAVSACRLARKGPVHVGSRAALRPRRETAQACKFGLRGHCCVVKRGGTG